MKIDSNKVAIVTGASQGIGFAIAKYLVSEGYQLLLISRNVEKLRRAADELKEVNANAITPEIASVDVSDYLAVKKIVERFINKVGHIDILCNNAGYAKRGTSDLSHEEFLKMINTNLIGSFNLVQTVTPFMKEKKSGRIINIVSRSGKIAKKTLGGYAASKFGMTGFNEALYKELVSHGIYVTAICPGFVATEMTADMEMQRADMIQPQDIAQTLDYLLKLSPSVAIKEIMMECRIQIPAE